ncbi:hypothetical protein K239x_56590 [Planctomycetes bacterium K23_9]|uniref:Peptidase MA-like domain-containing protein n=2 Tax=Stieleria marina TaxID=1930275 RepID=A0A517P2N3_9BACT|nr:hypothetical protein K239x_56590 [Planctomycetes bacterium K23_9]
MEAGYRLRFVLIAALTAIALGASNSYAANYRTQNFLIQAPNGQLAQAVGKAAEKYRAELATHWLGKQLPPWPRPCPIRVVAGQLAAQGVTTYSLQPVRDFQMEVVGTPERILDSVLPHEITHTILATHFGRPLPRWADEGICTTVEHISERTKHEAKLREFLRSRRGIAMNQLFLLTEYPNDVLPMYAQGYSVCRFLIEQKGAPAFISFLHDYMEQRSWTKNIQKYYGYKSLRELQEYWLAWVADGSGPVEKFAMADPAGSSVRLANGTESKPNDIALAAARSPRNLRSSRDTLNSNTSPRQFSQPKQPNQLKHANGAPIGGALAASLQTLPQRRAATSNDQVSAANGLGQSSDIGWYTRKRDEAKATLASRSGTTGQVTSPNTITPIVPPSVRDSGRYSVSQPQEEQQMSRQGMILRKSPSASDPVYILTPDSMSRRYR